MRFSARTTFLRLEQERLPSPFILDQLCRAMEGNGPACLRPAHKSEPPRRCNESPRQGS